VRTAILLPLFLLLSGCYVKLYGHQSTSGGVTTTTTSSTVVGGAKAGNARIAFSSGPAVPANAPGGQVTLNKGASAALVLGLVIADLVSYVRGGAKPASKAAGGPIAETCSCYGYRPDSAPEPVTE